MTNGGKTDIESLHVSELQEQLRELGEPSYRTGQITGWLYKNRVNTADEMTDLPRSLRTTFEKILRRQRSSRLVRYG